MLAAEAPAIVTYPSVIPLARSPALLLAVGLVHLMPMASVFGTGVPVWVRWVVCVFCAASLARECRAVMRLRKESLRPHSDGAQLLLSGQELDGRVLPSSVDMGALVVLHWQAEMGGRLQRFTLLRDAFSAEEWRVLKVWLRWSVMPQAARRA
ncbi:MAG TPA: protein YgfX [Rhodocyclaceae bacterium]|nr:protein YgfX [Rhodocyclaceae bacterium]